jgi:DNA polymerase III epsilon subunit family exonuclease
MNSLLDEENFKKLEKEYPYLTRARAALGEKPSALANHTFIIIDVETTGLDPLQCEIIEFGAIKIEKNEIKDIFNTLIAPRSSIPSVIEKITGITNEMVAGYPNINTAMENFLSFVGSDTLIAHNAEFDLGFIKHHAQVALNKNINNACICTLKLARFLLPNLSNHKLHTIAAYFKINTPSLHRAVGDCETTYQIWRAMLKLLTKKQILSEADLTTNGLIC